MFSPLPLPLAVRDGVVPSPPLDNPDKTPHAEQANP